MTRVKIGDKVKVISSDRTYRKYCQEHINKIGIVTSLIGGTGGSVNLDFEERPKEEGFFNCEVELVEENKMFHIGDKVKCVKVSDDYTKNFTIGKVYEVYEYKQYGDNEGWNYINSDNGQNQIVNHEFFNGFFELVKDDMKFKRGMKVRCLSTCCDGSFTKGKTYTIREDGIYPIVVADDNGKQNGWDSNFFEIVEDNMKSLEELVKTANDGVKAMAEIRKRDDKNKVFTTTNTKFEHFIMNQVPYYFTEGVDILQIKKKEFTEFNVGIESSWVVRINGENIHIGCRLYPISFIKEGFKKLIRDKMHSHSHVLLTLFATRDGIVEGNEKISWEDAEKILVALEEYTK